jgi:hypothetical protein
MTKRVDVATYGSLGGCSSFIVFGGKKLTAGDGPKVRLKMEGTPLLWS